MENQTLPEEKCTTDNHSKCCGGKCQLIFNIVAGVVLVLLVVMQFYNPFSKTGPAVNTSGGPSVAYVTSDSIMSQYELVDSLEAQLKRTSDSLDKDITAKQESFQARVNIYQQNLQNGKITTVDDAKRQETALTNEQEQLMGLRDLYVNRVSQMQMDMNMRILDSIVSVIKRFPEEFPYDYVLGYTRGAGILYASEKFDITKQVIAKMNDEYEAE